MVLGKAAEEAGCERAGIESYLMFGNENACHSDGGLFFFNGLRHDLR